jgi:hypothetical protein
VIQNQPLQRYNSLLLRVFYFFLKLRFAASRLQVPVTQRKIAHLF